MCDSHVGRSSEWCVVVMWEEVVNDINSVDQENEKEKKKVMRTMEVVALVQCVRWVWAS